MAGTGAGGKQYDLSLSPMSFRFGPSVQLDELCDESDYDDQGREEMSLPLIVTNSLFWQYKGRTESAWYLGAGDGVTVDMQNAYMDWCEKYHCDTTIINLNNEELMSLFADEYMRTIDLRKYDMFASYVQRLKARGAKIVFAFWDGPAIDPPEDAKYPCLRYMDRHIPFIQAACKALNPYARAYIVGIETNRYWSSEMVAQAIAITKENAGIIPVGTHEQWDPRERTFPGGDFCCYETRNHPKDGDLVPVAEMVADVQFAQSHLPPWFQMWVAERNLNPLGSRAREQARAIAELPGVCGVSGPIL